MMAKEGFHGNKSVCESVDFFTFSIYFSISFSVSFNISFSVSLNISYSVYLQDNFYPMMAKEGCFGGGNKSVRESVGILLLSAPADFSHLQ